MAGGSEEESATPAEALIRERIAEHGPLTFAQFAEIALYDPAVGYYAQKRAPFGAQGDYYTSAELHPGFAALLGQQVAQVWRALDRVRPFVVLEAGPGSGLFARDLLDWARAAEEDLYQTLAYRLDERSAALRLQQQRTLEAAGHGVRVSWVEGSRNPGPVHCVLANELLDALPVHLVQTRAGKLEELYVAVRDASLEFEPGPPSSDALSLYFDRVTGEHPPDGFRTEVNLAALDWIGDAAACLERGLLVVLDYGYRAAERFAARRRQGSLLCYYRHTLNSDALTRIGQQDITSQVDFDAVRLAGEGVGLATLGILDQRSFLVNLGWEPLRRSVAAAPLPQAERMANLRALSALVDPSGLGRVLALLQQRGLDGFEPLALRGGASEPWSYLPLRRPGHIRLPDASEAEGLADFEAQWAELWLDVEQD